MVHRIMIKKAWVNKFGRQYPVGSVLTVTPNLGSELIRQKVADKYTGEYPPNKKQKINLSQLNNNSDGNS
jgi:hypothetical protein